MKKVLGKDFFNRKTELVAKELLGKLLVRRVNGKKIAEIITEVEAYVGPHDLACHSSRGKTARNEIMFREAGTIYVYFTYGMHWMLNIVTEEESFPAAVLIRGLESVNGPARLTKKLGIDRKLNGKLVSKKNGLWFEDGGVKIPRGKILKTKRIGVDYAGPIWSKKKLRFVYLH
jgi:DNA-3-methyladenine glycosylase